MSASRSRRMRFGCARPHSMPPHVASWPAQIGSDARADFRPAARRSLVAERDRALQPCAAASDISLGIRIPRDAPGRLSYEVPCAEPTANSRGELDAHHAWWTLVARDAALRRAGRRRLRQ